MTNKPRLSQLIKKAGLAETRYDAEKMITDGRVKVDGVVITSFSYQTRPSTHKITVDDEPLVLVEEKLYYILNKPIRYSSQKGEHGKKGVLDLFDIKDQKVKNTLFAIGRLDENTTGLLIITNDGSLVQKILSPEKDVWKKYIATLNKDLEEKDIEKIRNGITVEIEDEEYKCKPAEIEQIGAHTYAIKVTEGKKRQVRQMVKATGAIVLELHRESIGNLVLPPKLEFGEYKAVTKNEILKALER